MEREKSAFEFYIFLRCSLTRLSSLVVVNDEVFVVFLVVINIKFPGQIGAVAISS